MKFYHSMSVLFLCVLVSCLFLFSCKDAAKTEKAGKFEITGVEYSIRQTHGDEGTQGTRGMSYVVDVRGKVKNIGDVDVKRMVVTGYCRSCILEFTGQRWFTSDCDKTENQKNVISYLPAGGEEEFSFEEVAFYFTHEKKAPENIPEKIEVVVESFETVK